MPVGETGGAKVRDGKAGGGSPGLHKRLRIARVLFCVHRHELIALHGFIKKTQKTAPADLDLAKKRMKEVTKS
jgi:phage-related protein